MHVWRVLGEWKGRCTSGVLRGKEDAGLDKGEGESREAFVQGRVLVRGRVLLWGCSIKGAVGVKHQTQEDAANG